MTTPPQVATSPLPWTGQGHSPVEALEIEDDIRWAKRRDREHPSCQDDHPPAQIERDKPR